MMLEDLERFWMLLKRGCGGPKMKCLHADLLDGFHGAHYEIRLNDDDDGDRDEVIDNPNLIAGTGITITRDGSNLTWAATNNGDVVGPATARDEGIAVYNGTSGKLLQSTDATIDDNDNMTVPGAIKSSSADDGVGYATGAGDTVTQETSKSEGVEINTVCGQITTHDAELTAGALVSFVVTNSAVAATDGIILNIVDEATGNEGSYLVQAQPATGGGAFRVSIRNLSGSPLSEALMINFQVIRGAIA